MNDRKKGGGNRLQDGEVLYGDLLEDGREISHEELCQTCALPMEDLVTYVQEGVLEASGGRREHWRFSITSIKRVRTARRLQRDLGVNVAGAALALDLLERIAELQRCLG